MIDHKKIVREICTAMGPTWKIIEREEPSELWWDDICDGRIVICFNYNSYQHKNKIHIFAYPSNGTPVDRNAKHDILYNRILRSDRDNWNLSINVSLKDTGKIARDIQRRLIPDANLMADAVDAKMVEIGNTINGMAAQITVFKAVLPGVVIRENRRQDASPPEHRWEAHICDKDFDRIAEWTMRSDGTVDLKFNGISVMKAALLIKDIVGDRKTI